jgi:hypothetical protein
VLFVVVCCQRVNYTPLDVLLLLLPDMPRSGKIHNTTHGTSMPDAKLPPAPPAKAK